MGYKIKEFREMRGITQEKLASLSGVSRGTICALENGTDRITTTKTLLKLATALNTTVDQLFYPEGVQSAKHTEGG